MPLYIKTKINDFLDFIWNNLKIISFLVAFLALFLIVRAVLGVSVISNFFESLFRGGNYDYTLLLNSLLFVATTASAIFAGLIFIKISAIGETVLETQKPNIEILVSDRIEDYAKIKFLTLVNTGNADADNICIFAKKYNEKLAQIESSLYLIKGTKYKIDYFSGSYLSSLVLCYTNPLNDKIYLVGYDIESSSNNLENLKENSSGIRYSDFLKIYRAKDSLSYNQIQRLVAQL